MARPDSAVRILGIGSTKTVGVRKGEIFDVPQARACLRDALNRAEDNANVEIASVHLAVTGAHIQGENNRGTYRLPEGQSVVTEAHLEEAREIALDIQIPGDHMLIHPGIRNYWLDGLYQKSSPVGLIGRTVAADFHIVHGIGSRIQNSIQLVRETPLEVEDVVFSPIATAHMALTSEHRERGALVVDIGGGTTDYVLYLEGSIAASGCIPVGGDHITNDLHLVTRLPLSTAERLKIVEGDATAAPARSVGIAKLEDERGYAGAEVERGLLNEVIRQRLEETLLLVRRRLPDNSVEKLGAGVFFTGGTSQMRGFSELAFEVFERDIFRPETPEIGPAQAKYRDPRYATALGLIRYALFKEADSPRKRGCLGRIMDTFWPFTR